MKDDKVYIQQMLDAVRKNRIIYCRHRPPYFRRRRKNAKRGYYATYAYRRNFKKISTKTKISIDLPWKDIAGFRDKAVHDYFEMDLDVVWNTIIADIPVLKSKLQKYS